MPSDLFATDCGHCHRRPIAQVEDVHLTRPPDRAQRARDHHHGYSPVAPREIVGEAPAHDHVAVGRVEAGEPTAADRFPVVVVDSRRRALAPRRPNDIAIRQERSRLEADIDGPAGSARPSSVTGARPTRPSPPIATRWSRSMTSDARAVTRPHDSSSTLTSTFCVSAIAVRGSETSSPPACSSRARPDEPSADDDGALDVGGEGACP